MSIAFNSAPRPATGSNAVNIIRFRPLAGSAITHKPGSPAAQRGVPYMTISHIFLGGPPVTGTRIIWTGVSEPRTGAYTRYRIQRPSGLTTGAHAFSGPVTIASAMSWPKT